MRETLWVPVVAVLGPLIGSAVGVLLPSRESLLHRLLAFAAGTMLTLSFLELIPESLSACSPPACAAGLAVWGLWGAGAAPPAAPHTAQPPRRGAPHSISYGRGHYAAQPPRRHRHGSRQRKPHHAAHRRGHRHPRCPRGHLHSGPLSLRHPSPRKGLLALPFHLPAHPAGLRTGAAAVAAGTGLYHGHGHRLHRRTDDHHQLRRTDPRFPRRQ